MELLQTPILQSTWQVITFLAAWLGTAESGVLLLTVDTLELAAPPPLLHDVLGPEPGDALVVLALLVEAGAEHETEEMGGAVAVLVERPQSEAATWRLSRTVTELDKTVSEKSW